MIVTVKNFLHSPALPEVPGTSNEHMGNASENLDSPTTSSATCKNFFWMETM